MRVNSFDSRDVTAWETVSRKLAKFGRRSRGPLSAAVRNGVIKLTDRSRAYLPFQILQLPWFKWVSSCKTSNLEQGPTRIFRVKIPRRDVYL